MNNYSDYKGKKRGLGGGIIALIVIISVIAGTVAGAGMIYAVTQVAEIEPTPTATVDTGASLPTPQPIIPSPDPGITELPDITAPPIDSSEPIADIYDKMKDTVVLVTAYCADDIYTGSGVIFTQDGYIITNQHVINGATRITVTLCDGTEKETVLVGSDERSDLAVVKISDGGTYHAAALGNSSELRVGQTVIAIGCPLGYSGTLTHGVVSYLDRVVDDGGTRYKMIQTDCPINPGNSGGPLFNMDGEVIGITTRKQVYAVTSNGDIPTEGIGYAIPIDSAKEIVLALISEGKVKRAALGIMAQSNVENNQYAGVTVVSVTKDGPADAAGIKVNDIIVEMDGVSILKMEDLSEQLSYKQVGQSIQIKVKRGGEEKSLTVVLGELG